MYKKTLRIFTLFAVCLIFTGCAAVSAEIHHNNLHVASKMSNSVFLNPLDTENKNIFVEVRNTSTESLHNLNNSIKDELRDGGYNVVNNPKHAHTILQVNVLQFGRAKNAQEVWRNAGSGYGSVVTGALVGIGVGTLAGSTKWGVGAGLAVAAMSWIADETIQNKTYSVITDIQISVNNDGNVTKYNTRIASIAEKVNLQFNEAKPALVNQVSHEIADIFVSN